MSRSSATSTKYHRAALNGDLDTLRPLLEGVENINLTKEDGATVLHEAASSGQLKVVERLVKSGAAVNAKAHKRVVPLHLAARFGHCDVIRALLDGGAKINRRDFLFNTPLMYACHFSQLAAAETLIARGCDVNYEDKSSRTALHWAIKEGTLELVHLLHKAGADLNVPDKFGKTPLMQAVKSNRLDILKFLLSHDVALDAEETYCRPALHIAAAKERYRCMDELLKAGVSANMRNSHGSLPLFMAMQECNLGAMNTLLANGADPNGVNQGGLTPLLFVVNSSIRPHFGRSVLPLEPSVLPFFDAAFLLLDANADLDLMSDSTSWYYGKVSHPHNALEFAANGNQKGMAKLFARAGSSPGNLWSDFKMKSKDLPQYFRSDQNLFDWIRRHYKSPLSLKVLSRKKFRGSIRGDFNRAVSSLSLPPGLSRYLHYSDMEDLKEEFGSAVWAEDGTLLPVSEPEDSDSEREYNGSEDYSSDYNPASDFPHGGHFSK